MTFSDKIQTFIWVGFLNIDVLGKKLRFATVVGQNLKPLIPNGSVQPKARLETEF